MTSSKPTDQLTLFAAEPPVSPSQLQDSERAWLTRVATWPSSFLDLLTASGLAGSFGRMSLASCQAQEDGTLVPSLGRWENSGMGGPTECWTLSSSEFPNGAGVCSLSDVLETGDVPQRYFLSATACKGILRRAEKRGRELPEALRQALEGVAQKSSSTPSSAETESH